MISVIKNEMIVIFVALSISGTGIAWSQEGNVPFAPGERLTFVLKWGFIRAGKATLEVHPMEIVNGVESYHFVMTAKSRSFLDNIYKVRDRIDAYADVGMNRSVLYNKKQGKEKPGGMSLSNSIGTSRRHNIPILGTNEIRSP